MKVSIIGGGGLVGSCAAFALQCGGVVSEIDLIDVNADLCQGPGARPAPRRLARGRSADPRDRLRGDPRERPRLITAGLRRKPDESRLDLINRNVELFLNILGQVKAAGPEARRDRPGRLEPGRRADLPGDDAARPARRAGDRPGHAARHGPVPQPDRRGARSCRRPRSRRLILGEHGDSMVPIWSAAQAGGPAAGEVPRLDSAHGRGPLRADQGQRRRGDQAQGRRGVRRRPVDPRGRPRRRARPEADPAGLVAGQRRLRHPRRLHLGADGRRPQGRRGPARDRALAQGGLGAPALGARCSARRSTRCSRATPRPPASRGSRPAARPAAAGRPTTARGRSG